MDIDDFLDLQFDLNEQQEEVDGQQYASVASSTPKQMPQRVTPERKAGPAKTSKRPLNELSLNGSAIADVIPGDRCTLPSRTAGHTHPV